MSNEEELLDDEAYMMVLVDEEGAEHEFELLAELEIEDETYRVLAPISDEEEDEDVVIILKVVFDEDGTELMSEIEDDGELEMVVAAWEQLEDSLED